MASATARAINGATKVWHTVDAKGMIVGRLAQHVAKLLQGKGKPFYTPGVDCGDYVVILNADKVRFTGRKATDKVYYWHTGYPGGIKQRTAAEMFDRAPERVLRRAIKGMLPKNRLQNSVMLRRLRIEASEANRWVSQCASSGAAAPSYIASSRPADSVMGSTAGAEETPETPLLRHHIRFSEPEAIDVEAMAAETLGDPDFDLLARVFSDVWEKERTFWAERHAEVPEDIYDKHGIPYPGDGEPSMAASEAAEHVVAQANAYWAEHGEASQKAAVAALDRYKESDGAEWAPADRR